MKKNTETLIKGRTFAIGDIHGCHSALITLLDKIKPTQEDMLIFLGDYVNRGENSKAVLDTLMNLSEVCQTVFIMGNHELIMLDGLKYPEDFDFWLRVGGDKTLQSFHLLPRRSECLHLPFEYVRFLKSLNDYYETDKFIFCHASIYSHLSMSEQNDYALRWRKLENNHQPHISGKTIICGHSEQKDGKVLLQEGIICIDTWAYGGGYLTALEINTMQAHQANNQGDFLITTLDYYK